MLKTVCKSDHKQLRYKTKSQSHFILSQKTLLRSSRSFRDPPAIIKNTCYDVINCHCFFIAFSDLGSQENDKIIADRHFFFGRSLIMKKMHEAFTIEDCVKSDI